MPDINAKTYTTLRGYLSELFDLFGQKGENMERKISLRNAGALGIISPIVAFIGIGIAILQAPWFSLTYSWLSDLGVDANAAPWFNTGLILAGIIGFLFALSVTRLPALKTLTGRIGLIVLLIGMIALTTIGIFTEDFGSIHTLVAFTFFVSVGVALVALGLAFRKETKKFGTAMILIGAISLASLPTLVMPRPYGSNALVELIPAVTVAVFSVTLAVMLIRNVIHE
jgi:hypothetical membrane protein